MDTVMRIKHILFV